MVRMNSVEGFEDNPLEYVEEVEATDDMKASYKEQLAEMESKLRSLEYQKI